MIIIIEILLFVFLSIIAYQDIKSREVSWFLFPLVLIMIAAKGLFYEEAWQLAGFFVINFLFLIIQLGVLFIFYAFRHKKFENIINRKIGFGDLLFLIVLSAGFAPMFFEIFLTASFIVILLAYVIWRSFSKPGANKTIPLAGGLASLYMIVLISGYFIPAINIYNNYLIEDLFIGK